MRKWLRRLRGGLGMGELWGAAGAVTGALAGLVVGLIGGIPLGGIVSAFSLYAGVLGFLLGTGFAASLAALAERGTLGELTPKRGAVLGALAGALVPLGWLLMPFGELLTDLTALPTAQVIILLVVSEASCAALGAGLATGTLALARRAPPELGSAETADEQPPSFEGAGSILGDGGQAGS